MPGFTLRDGLTLKNKLDAENWEELEAAERDFVMNREAEIRLGLVEGFRPTFDEDHLRALHHHLFQDVFEWAGQTRNERFVFADGSIGSGEQTLRKLGSEPFLPGDQIPSALADIGRSLKEDDYLRNMPRHQFAEKASDLLIELNNIHPFREGNGRTQRLFVEQLAEQGGHYLNLSYISQERMTQASIESHENGDNGKMRRIFDESTNPDRVAMLKNGTDFLSSKDFDWNRVYVATFQPGVPTEVLLSNIIDTEFVARTHDAVMIGHRDDLPEELPKRGVKTVITAQDRGASAQGQGDLDPRIARMAEQGRGPVEQIEQSGKAPEPDFGPDHDPTPQPRRGRRR